MWREEGRGPFSGFKAALISNNTVKAKAYQDVLRAGGASIDPAHTFRNPANPVTSSWLCAVLGVLRSIVSVKLMLICLGGRLESKEREWVQG